MSTIKDVARIANVSVATVSRVVNNGPKVGIKTRQRVQQVMDEIGYRPNANARALVTQKSATIGVVIPALADPFFASLANAVEQIARKHGMQLLLSTGQNSAESEMKAIDLLIERRCEVMVVHSKMLTTAQLISLCENVPGLVLIDRYIEEVAHRCIWLDNEEGGRIAARHLMALNHRQFACISSDYSIDDPALRLSGFKQELARAKLALEPALIDYQAPTLSGGEIATQNLIAKGLPFTALFAYNDAMAIGAISTLADNGFKVPDDVSVVGFDDVLLSRYSRPKLSTLHYPIEKMAMQAALLAIDLASNAPRQPKNLALKHIPTLVKRQSTANNNV